MAEAASLYSKRQQSRTGKTKQKVSGYGVSSLKDAVSSFRLE